MPVLYRQLSQMRTKVNIPAFSDCDPQVTVCTQARRYKNGVLAYYDSGCILEPSKNAGLEK